MTLDSLGEMNLLSKCQLPGFHGLGVREGFPPKKNQQIIHFWWIGVSPSPPLIHLGEVNSIYIREFSLSTFGDPLPPLALIHLY